MDQEASKCLWISKGIYGPTNASNGILRVP